MGRRRTSWEASWDAAAALLPVELKAEWCRFLDTKPQPGAVVDWCQVKAAEHGWDYFDMSAALVISVRRPDVPKIDQEVN